MTTSFTRRGFIKGAAALATAVPWLRASDAFAAAGPPPKRIVFFCTPVGAEPESLWPSSMSGTWPYVFEPLQPLRHKMIVIRNMDVSSALVDPITPDHQPDWTNALVGRQAMVVGGRGRGSAASVDQLLVQRLGEAKLRPIYGAVGTIASLSPFWSAPNVQVPLELSPFNVFTDVFAGVSTSATPSAEVLAARRVIARKRSILNGMMGEVTRLRCSMGAEHREVFDSHVDAIRALEVELADDGTPPATCSVPQPGSTFDVRATVNYPRAAQLHLDIIARAIACRRTALAGLLFRRTATPWLATAQEDTHYYAHWSGHDYSERLAKTKESERWFAAQLARLATTLDSIPEGDGGTVLDNTIIVWVHEQAQGKSHRRIKMPYVLVGGGGGALRTGRFVDFAGKASRHHNNLLLSLSAAMGVSLETIGDPQFCSGPLSELLG